jgi:hypothetical protein
LKIAYKKSNDKKSKISKMALTQICFEAQVLMVFDPSRSRAVSSPLEI